MIVSIDTAQCIETDYNYNRFAPDSLCHNELRSCQWCHLLPAPIDEYQCDFLLDARIIEAMVTIGEMG